MAGFWQDRSVLITGSSFAGPWLARRLVEEGAGVVTFMQDYAGYEQLGLGKKVSAVRGKSLNYHDVERTLNEYEVGSVFHVGGSVQKNSAVGILEEGVKGAWNVLEACRNSKLVEGMVLASSCRAYGEGRQPYKESTPVAGTGLRAVSESCVDLLARSYYFTYKMPVAIARFGSVYGGADADYDRLVPGTMRSVLKKQRPVIRGDGGHVRDYLYVKDAVDAYLVLAEKAGEKKVRGEAFNFGTGRGISALEVVERILKVAGSKLKPKVLNRRLGTAATRRLSVQKARKRLGWKAKYSLDKGLQETLKWYKRNLTKKRR